MHFCHKTERRTSFSTCLQTYLSTELLRLFLSFALPSVYLPVKFMIFSLRSVLVDVYVCGGGRERERESESRAFKMYRPFFGKLAVAMSIDCLHE